MWILLRHGLRATNHESRTYLITFTFIHHLGRFGVSRGGFLKEALKTVKKNEPFRGADKYKKEHFEYINKVKGDIKSFKGEEKIFYNNKLVYVLTYHGGFIKKKDLS